MLYLASPQFVRVPRYRAHFSISFLCRFLKNKSGEPPQKQVGGALIMTSWWGGNNSILCTVTTDKIVNIKDVINTHKYVSQTRGTIL